MINEDKYWNDRLGEHLEIEPISGVATVNYEYYHANNYYCVEVLVRVCDDQLVDVDVVEVMAVDSFNKSVTPDIVDIKRHLESNCANELLETAIEALEDEL